MGHRDSGEETEKPEGCYHSDLKAQLDLDTSNAQYFILLNIFAPPR